MSFGLRIGPHCSVTSQRPPPDSATIDLVVEGPFDRAGVDAFCDELRKLLQESGADVAACDVRRLDAPDGGTVDALARMQLTARRIGCRIRLRHAGDKLQELLDLMGLRDVVPAEDELHVETRGEAEQREQALGVKEE